MSNIFRKAALERLASPEQLDKMIKITSPMVWAIHRRNRGGDRCDGNMGFCRQIA